METNKSFNGSFAKGIIWNTALGAIIPWLGATEFRSAITLTVRQWSA
jgi:hypothetical protein